ncbi:MAG: phospholipase A [Pseudomonadales bacterium]
MNTRTTRTVATLGLMLIWLPAAAGAPDPESTGTASEQACLLQALAAADDALTVGELRLRCRPQEPGATESLIMQRLEREATAERVRSLLTAHRRNYLLPATYMDDPNDRPFRDSVGDALADDALKQVEAKFQLSLKLALASGLVTTRDRLYLGFTTQSYWQAYNTDISAPFRETNYEPELFWVTPLDGGPFDLDAGLLTLGFSHQSNGRGGTLSRSWNRLYANVAFEKDNLVVSLKPWWRIPERRKDDPLEAEGDDNPDIEKYLGHFEFNTIYRRWDHEFGLMLRNNLRSDNRGAVQLDWTFPLWGGLRGYAQYFNGYGESLIDYDARIERIGIGILLTDLL